MKPIYKQKTIALSILGAIFTLFYLLLTCYPPTTRGKPQKKIEPKQPIPQSSPTSNPPQKQEKTTHPPSPSSWLLLLACIIKVSLATIGIFKIAGYMGIYCKGQGGSPHPKPKIKKKIQLITWIIICITIAFLLSIISKAIAKRKRHLKQAIIAAKTALIFQLMFVILYYFIEKITEKKITTPLYFAFFIGSTIGIACADYIDTFSQIKGHTNAPTHR